MLSVQFYVFTRIESQQFSFVLDNALKPAKQTLIDKVVNTVFFETFNIREELELHYDFSSY